MFPKLLILLVAMAATGAVLLGLRADRLAGEHEIAHLHQRIDDSRRAVWDAQVRVADDAGPEAIQRMLAESGVELQPVLAAEPTPSGENRYVAAEPPRR